MARSSSIHSTAASVAVVNQANGNNNNVDTTDAGDADGDGDDRTYCFCDGVSYGEMIACDDENCEREWVIILFDSILVSYLMGSVSSILVVLDLHNLHKANGIVTHAKIRRMGKGLPEGANGGQGGTGQVVEVNVKSR